MYVIALQNISLTPGAWSNPVSLENTYVILKFPGKIFRQYANFTYFPCTRPISDVIFGLYAPFYLLEKVFESFFGVILEIIAIFLRAVRQQ